MGKPCDTWSTASKVGFNSFVITLLLKPTFPTMKAANHYRVIDVTNWANLTTITRAFKTGGFAFGSFVAPANLFYGSANTTIIGDFQLTFNFLKGV